MESKTNENDSNHHVDILNNDSKDNLEDIISKEQNDNSNNNSLKDIEEEFKCINDEIELNNNIKEEVLDIKNIEQIKINDEEQKNILIDNENTKENLKEFSQREIKIHNDIKIPEGAKYGIDKNGNPVEISKIKGNEIIAIIIQEENKENYLIDIKGNILQKTEDDYYYYKNGEEVIIIKNFDVKNPELRIYGHRKINFAEIKKNFDEKIIKENKIMNKNASFLLINSKEKEKEKIDKKLNEANTYANINSSNTNNFVSKNKSVILDDKNNLNINIGNINFKNQMEMWRKRYGKNNEFFDKNAKNNTEIINNEKPLRKYSYRKIEIINNNNYNKNNELVTRTDSILKMATNKNKIIPLIRSPDSKYKKLTLTNNSNNIKSILYNRNYSYGNIKEDNYEYEYKKLILKEKDNIKNKRKKDIEYINSKYNNFTTDFNYNKYNEEEKNQREILLKNIKTKYSRKINNNSYIIDNNISNINNNDNNNVFKYSKIDDYIYNNIRKINYIKKNKNMKCSVLKTEVNQIISNFNKNQLIKERQRIHYGSKNEKLFYQYNDDNTNMLYKKIKIIPSKIRKNKLEIYNNNFDINNSIKLDNKFFNNNNYYRKIKHNKY